MHEDNQLEGVRKRVGGLVALALWTHMYPHMADVHWLFEQAEVERRLGREVTVREKQVYLEERRKAFLTPAAFHDAVDRLVSDLDLRQQLHQSCEELVEQAQVDEVLRQIARDLSKEER